MPTSSSSQKAIAAGVLLLAGLGAIALLRSSPCPSSTSSPPSSSETADDDVTPRAKDPRLVLRRPWFDQLPKKRTDEIEIWVFFGSGFGLHDKGSMFRSTMDFFDFERAGSKVDLVFLQDKKKQAVRFDVVACHDKPPFDLCLDVKEPLRGKTRLYSWDDDADMDAAVPWAKEWRAGAEARARGAR